MKYKKTRKVISFFLAVIIFLTGFPFSEKEQIAAEAAELGTESDNSAKAAKSPADTVYTTGEYELKDITIEAEPGKSGILIDGNVTLIIEGTVNVTGGDAYLEKQSTSKIYKDIIGNDQYVSYDKYIPHGAGAGIEVPEGSSLTIKGGGTLNVQGGKAGDGADGAGMDDSSMEKLGINYAWNDIEYYSKDHLKLNDEKNKIPHSEVFPERGGQGGGGAGAGIGGRGADNSHTSPGVGTITIDDPGLNINAVGGAGGSGGSGGAGSSPYRFRPISPDTYFTDTGVEFSMIVPGPCFHHVGGGIGGQGGGGGGYPAAGIGSGGAAGGQGGSGGQGAEDEVWTYLIFLGVCIAPSRTFSAAGGGGGGGGQGYQNGGGGAGGVRALGSYNPQWITSGDYSFIHPDETVNSVGGAAGQDAPATDGGETVFRDVTGTSGKGGYADGRGGECGIGQNRPSDSSKKALNGYSGNKGGKIIEAGMITINSGTVVANATDAQTIGCGGGYEGNVKGNLIIRGGNVADSENMLVPTNGSETVYPVVVSPFLNEGDINDAMILIDGEDSKIRSLYSKNGKGQACIWLPESKEGSVYKIHMYRPYQTAFDVTVTKEDVDIRYSDDKLVCLDFKNGDIIFTEDGYLQQAENTWFLAENLYLFVSGSREGGCEIVCRKGSGQKVANAVTIEDVSNVVLNISDSYDNNSKLIVNVVGSNNQINYINLTGPDSKVDFQGDAESKVDVNTIYGYHAKVYGNPCHVTYPFNEVLTEKIAGVSGFECLELDECEYITDLIIGSVYWYDDVAGMQQDLRNAGYTIIEYDLNTDTTFSGNYIYLGYKTSGNVIENDEFSVSEIRKSAGEAVCDIVTFDEYRDSIMIDGYTYVPVPTRGTDQADLNRNAGGDSIYLYYRKASPFDETPVTALDVYWSGDGNTQYCSTCHDDWVGHLGNGKKDLNEGAGGPYIYLAMGKKFKNTFPEYTVSNATHHAGSIVMNSRGEVSIGEIYNNGEYVNNNGFRNVMEPAQYKAYYNGSTRSEYFYGTPSIEVNSGCLNVDTYLGLHEVEWPHNNDTVGLQFLLDDESFTGIIGMNPEQKAPYIKKSLHEDHEKWVGTRKVRFFNFFGNNKIGDITINGGMLKIGENGKGDMGKPAGYEALTSPKVTIKPGGMLQCANNPYGADGYKLVIKDLPADRHFTNVTCSDSDDVIGSVSGIDFRTNDDGEYITYLPTDFNASSELYFADDQGHLYAYRITVNNGKAEAVKFEPANLEASYLSDEAIPLKMYPHYAVYGDKVYGITSSYTVHADYTGGILFNQNMEMTLKAEAEKQHTISEILGDGRLTFTGKNFNITKDVQASSLTFSDGTVFKSGGALKADDIIIKGGTITSSGVNGRLQILGGSVKTDKPIIGATNGETPLYLVMVEGWDPKAKIDGKQYPGLTQDGHGDDKMYLYVSKNAKTLEANGKFYYLEYDNSNSTMKLIERKVSDGYIDISAGSAQILDDGVYIHNGNYYLNKNGNRYVISGTTDKNALTVKAKDVQILMNGVNMAAGEGSAVTLENGVKAVITLQGTSRVSASGLYPAIHVSEGAELKMTGSGMLSANAGNSAPAIGGMQYQKNGKVIIDGGTYNLQSRSIAAIGAGMGGNTPESSIVINKGTLNMTDGSKAIPLSVTPVSSSGEKLSLLRFTPDTFGKLKRDVENFGGVKIDGENFEIPQLCDDGRLYLYLTSGKHTITVGNREYKVLPVNIGEMENGKIVLTLNDGDDRFSLNSGDMVIEGANVSMEVVPDEGYGIKKGPETGDYVVVEQDGEMFLQPVSDVNRIPFAKWGVVTEGEGDNETFIGLNKEIDGEELIAMGKVNAGEAVAELTLGGEGLKAELLADGKVIETYTLTDQPVKYRHIWTTDSMQEISLRLVGKGDALISSSVIGNSVNVKNITAEFAKVYTLEIEQVQIVESGESGADVMGHYVYVCDENFKTLKDADYIEGGIQVFEGQTVILHYVDLGDGEQLEKFNITYVHDNKTEEYTFNNKRIIMNQDVKVSYTTYEVPYYIVNIPQSIELEDEGSDTTIDLSRVVNMQEKDNLNIRVGGLNDDGELELLMRGKDGNKLTVPVANSDMESVKNNDIIAQFADNEKVAKIGGKLKFGSPAGDKKAGFYEGMIKFSIDYDTAG